MNAVLSPEVSTLHDAVASKPSVNGRVVDDLAEGIDEIRAQRTVPLGSSARDPRRTAGVDLAIWTLHVRYERTEDPAVLDLLVEEYRAYACSIARRLDRHAESFDDLQQVALEALVTSLQRFHCERRTPFPAFATPTILGAIKRHYRDRGWSVRVPRSVHEAATPVRQATDHLTAALGRNPSAAEVADEVGVDESTVVSVRIVTRARAVASLDRPRADSDGALGDTVGVIDSDLIHVENHVALAEAMTTLDDRDRAIVALYFFDDLSQSEIADRFDVSQMQVSRWIASIVGRLRSRLVPA